MKLIKKSFLVVIAVLVLILGMAFSACENFEYIESDRQDKAEVMDWHYLMLSTSSNLVGVPLIFGFEDAEIEMKNSSADTMFILFTSNIENWDSYPAYENHGVYKKALHGDCPVIFSSAYYFRWAPANGWNESDRKKLDISDYVTFISRIDNNIVGYAVIYLHTDGNEGSGEVLADKEFPQVDGEYQEVSEKAVNKKIQAVIENHKNK